MPKIVIIWFLLILTDGLALALISYSFYRMKDVDKNRIGTDVAKLFLCFAIASLGTSLALVLWPAPAQPFTLGVAVRMTLRSIEVVAVWWFYLAKLKSMV